MSAIVGVYWLDGNPAAQDSLPRLMRALAHRGPHGRGSWTEGPVGLGHQLLHTTPESTRETQPLLDSGSGLVLVADARIDNRSELCHALRLPHPAAVSDSELILAAYREWGTACVPRLIGDFAFAVWDPRRQMVFCARDPMGVKPFYYYHSPRLFAFATEIKALLALPDVPRRVDDEQVELYLATPIVDRVSTFYHGIRRLPAAHTMAVTARGAKSDAYWDAAAQPRHRFTSDAQYVGGFRETFREAVLAQLRSAAPVGATLSGGLDSSSVVCVARGMMAAEPLHTFSLVFPSLEGHAFRMIDERAYMERVVAGGGVSAHFIRGDELSPLADLDRMLWHLDQPFAAPNLYLHWGMYRAAQQCGVRVFLDGFDGDTTVGHGLGRLHELGAAGQWSTFETEARAFAAHRQIAAGAVLPHYGLPLLADYARRGRWLQWLRGARELARRFELSRRDVLLRYGLSPLVQGLAAAWRGWGGWGGWGGGESWLATLRPAVRRRMAARLRETTDSAGSDPLAADRTRHLAGLGNPLYQSTLEIADRCAAAFGLEARYPFFDRRLIEFCLGVPSEQKFAHGWTRWTMRRAMEGVLPPEIQWRGNKANLGPNYRRQLSRADAPVLDRAPLAALAPYVDVARAQALRARVLAQTETDAERVLVYRMTVLASWLADGAESRGALATVAPLAA